MNFLEFNEQFPEEIDVIKYYINTRYNGQVRCNHCSSLKVSYRKDQPKLFQCNNCNNSFSIFKGTIFEKTTTDLRKWFHAIHLILNAKKGISGKQLEREIGVTYKTAWRILHQIRKAMGNDHHDNAFEAIVEIDETYVGGKPRKLNKREDDKDQHNPRGRGTKKIPIVGMIDRDNHKVYAKVAMPDKEGKKLSSKQILKIMDRIIRKDAIIISDEFRSYNALKRRGNIHLVIDHTKMFVDGKIHTNTVESFWATLKRGIYGIYHHVSPKYLQRYVDEFCFRYNNRQVSMFDKILSQAILSTSRYK